MRRDVWLLLLNLCLSLYVNRSCEYIFFFLQFGVRLHWPKNCPFCPCRCLVIASVVVKHFIWKMEHCVNPLLNFRAESCMDAPANSIFSRPVTSTFSALHFHDHPFTCQYNKENKGFRV